MGLSAIAESFTAAGGHFLTPAAELARKLAATRAVVFDWDGVFNDGRKGHASGSGFAEADSMGTNMLRYGLWRRDGELPVVAIISGESNESAHSFARREHFNAVYTGIRDKRQVVEHLCDRHGLQPAQLACVFDDINDIPMARICGLRFQVRRPASPLFAALAATEDWADYVTAAAGDEFAVREICELLLGLSGQFADVVQSRVAGDESYREYFELRQAIDTDGYAQDGDNIVSRDIT